MNTLIVLASLILLPFAVYRITRFFIMDTVIDGTRDKIHNWLLRPNDDQEVPLLRFKAHELLSCPYCLSVWVAAACVVFWSLVIADQWIGWSFLIFWPAVAGAALVPYEYVDAE